MTKQLKFRIDGEHVDIEWPDGHRLAVLPYNRGIEGLARDLTEGGTFILPGGGETITRLEHRVVHLFAPGRAFARAGIADDRTTLAHWLEEEARLNNERYDRLTRWRRAVKKGVK